MFKPRKPTRAQVQMALLVHGASKQGAESITGEPRPPTTRKRGVQSNRRRGTSIEGEHRGKGVSAVLRRHGYEVVRSHESQGEADVIGIRRPGVVGPYVRKVQAKRVLTFKPSGLNDAIARFLGLGKWTRSGEHDHDTRREAWLWADDHQGWVAMIYLSPDDAMTFTGAKAEEVRLSVEAHITRLRAPKPEPSPTSLTDRLTA